jgi:hypothetical protein
MEGAIRRDADAIVGQSRYFMAAERDCALNASRREAGAAATSGHQGRIDALFSYAYRSRPLKHDSQSAATRQRSGDTESHLPVPLDCDACRW